MDSLYGIIIILVALIISMSLIGLIHSIEYCLRFTDFVMQRGKLKEATLIKKKLHIVDSKNLDFETVFKRYWYILVTECMYEVETKDENGVKKIITVTSIEPEYCIFKSISKKYKIHVVEYRYNIDTKTSKLHVINCKVATKHDYYSILYNFIKIVLGSIILLYWS